MAVLTSADRGLMVSKAGGLPDGLPLSAFGLDLPGRSAAEPNELDAIAQSQEAYERCLRRQPGAVSDVVLALVPNDGDTNARLLTYALQGIGPEGGPSLHGAPGRVWIAPGEYPVDRPVTLGPAQMVVGAGRIQGTTLRGAGGNAILRVASGADFAGVRDIELAGAAQQGIGVSVTRARQVTVQRVRFTSLGVGIAVGEGSAWRGAAVDLLSVSGCAFEYCGTGIQTTRAVRELSVVGCAFVLSRQCRAGLISEGDGAVITGNHFGAARNARGGDAAARQPAIIVGGRGTWVRFNVFEGPAPQVLLEAAADMPDHSPGNIVEYNVHVSGWGGRGPVDDGPFVEATDLPALVRGAGSQAQRSGESAWNLLRNGSLEWWRGPRQPLAWSLQRLGGEAEAEMWVEALPAAAGGNKVESTGEGPTSTVLSPGARHGARGARLFVQSSGGAGAGLALRGELAAQGERGLGTDAQLTFSCWIRVPRPGATDAVPSPYIRWWSGDAVVARSRAYNRAALGTWQLLSCTVEGRPSSADLHQGGSCLGQCRHVGSAG